MKPFIFFWFHVIGNNICHHGFKIILVGRRECVADTKCFATKDPRANAPLLGRSAAPVCSTQARIRKKWLPCIRPKQQKTLFAYAAPVQYTSQQLYCTAVGVAQEKHSSRVDGAKAPPHWHASATHTPTGSSKTDKQVGFRSPHSLCQVTTSPRLAMSRCDAGSGCVGS